MSSKPCKHGCGRPVVPGRAECEACRYARRKGRPTPYMADETMAAVGPIASLARAGEAGPSQPPDEVASALVLVRAMIGAVAKGCPAVELRVLDLAAERLALGLDRYGAMPEDDQRDLGREATEEAIDGFIYALEALLRGGDQ